MAKRTKKADKQLDLIDVLPEKCKPIIEVARRYKKVQQERLAALKEETELKQKVLGLVKNAGLKPLADGIIRFTCDGFTISVEPRDELIKVKELQGN